MARHPEIGSWAVGGHSLGGVSAAAFAAANHDVSGLLLFASYPAENMTDAQGLSVLSISGSNDGLSTPDKIAASKSLLPPNASYATVMGGVHAFFGDYGEQPGDGEPGITREQAQQQIAAESLRFMDRLEGFRLTAAEPNDGQPDKYDICFLLSTPPATGPRRTPVLRADSPRPAGPRFRDLARRRNAAPAPSRRPA